MQENRPTSWGGQCQRLTGVEPTRYHFGSESHGLLLLVRFVITARSRRIARRMGGAKRYPSIDVCKDDGFRNGLMVRDARRRAPYHEGLGPHPEEHRQRIARMRAR